MSGYVRMYVWVCARVCTYVCVRPHVWLRARVCVFACVCVPCVCVCECVCVPDVDECSEGEGRTRS